MGNLAQGGLQSALDEGAPDWRSWPEAKVAAWLRAQRVKNARGLWLDAKAVSKLKASLSKAAHAREASAEKRFAEEVEGLRGRLVALIAELQGAVSDDRLAELSKEHDSIGLPLLADQGWPPALSRGWEVALRMIEKRQDAKVVRL